MPSGSRSWPLPEPLAPNWLRYLPSGPNSSIRLLPRICYPNITFGVDRKRGRPFQGAFGTVGFARLAGISRGSRAEVLFGFAAASFRCGLVDFPAKGLDEFAFPVELLDAVVGLIGDPEAAFGAQGDIGGMHEFAAFTVAAGE